MVLPGRDGVPSPSVSRDRAGRDGVPSPSAAGGGTPALPDRPNPATGRHSIIAINVSASPSTGGS